MDIRKFVDRIFTDSQSITLEEKSEFGQLVRSSETRLLFAQYVDDYRVNSKRVSELTFYSLAQYFSIVLLECLLAEDFRPAKIIMNMMFTYYYEQNLNKIPLNDRQKFILSTSETIPMNNPTPQKQQFPQNLYRPWKRRLNHKNGNNNNNNIDKSNNNSHYEYSGSSSSNSLDINDDVDTTNSDEYQQQQQHIIKVYLYTLLKDQEIFKSIRFWTSAFYESVIIERKKHPVFVNREQGKLSEEKRIEESDCSKNITFGLLGSFIHNMSLLDLSHEFCQEFLDKHSAIAGLSGDQLEMLRTNMETMFGDVSLKKAIQLVESTSLNRTRVCVVSIISKDALDESAKSYLVQSILSKNNIDKKKNVKSDGAKTSIISQTKQINQFAKDGNKDNDETIIGCNSLVDNDSFENQVIGNVDTKTDVIVMNLTSFMETEKLLQLVSDDNILNTKLSSFDKQSYESTLLLELWPKWNQNLIKTLLMLFLMSHIVVFYNPEPSIDYNLIELLKIIEILRLKSQTRITDLLETIASKQMFSQQWIRQGRIACPRALFVCDTSYSNCPIRQSDIINIKRDLEDQIYKLLKKTQISYRLNLNNQSNQSTLLYLPEQEDFVFIITRYNPNQSLVSATNDENIYSSRNKNKRDVQESSTTNSTYNNNDKQERGQFYTKLFETLNIKKNYLDEDESDEMVVPTSFSTSISGCGILETNKKQSATSIDDTTKDVFPFKTTHHNRFRKFLKTHITDIQNPTDQSLDNNNKNNNNINKLSINKKNNYLLPRYDDFFNVLLRLKNLLFPTLEISSGVPSISNECNLISGSQDSLRGEQINTIAKQDIATQLKINWESPDERRFIDIYDLINCDELFSKVHCHKTRIAAFDFYLRHLQLQPITQVTHESSTESAKLFYLHHGRGSACSQNLDLLIDQCNQYWENCKRSFDNKNNRNLANKSRINSGQTNSGSRTLSTSNSINNSPTQSFESYNNKTNNDMDNKTSKQTSLTISRRSNCLRVSAICSCNKSNNYLITPVDKNKKLERLDIKHID